MSKKSLLSLLNGNNWGSFHRPLAVHLGLHETVLLTELVDKHGIYGDKNQGWFYLSREDIFKRTGIKKDMCASAIKKLEKLGLIETEVMGLPATRHFRLNVDAIVSFMDALESGGAANKLAGFRQLDCGIPPTPHIRALTTNERPLLETTDIGCTHPPSVSFPAKAKKAVEEKLEMATHVWITPTQHLALLKKAKGDLALVQIWYDFLSDWLLAREIRDNKSSYGRICQWVIKAVEELHSKNAGMAQSGIIQKRKLMAQKWEKESEGRQAHEKKVIAHPDYLIFAHGQSSFNCSYSSPLLEWESFVNKYILTT